MRIGWVKLISGRWIHSSASLPERTRPPAPVSLQCPPPDVWSRLCLIQLLFFFYSLEPLSISWASLGGRDGT